MAGSHVLISTGGLDRPDPTMSYPPVSFHRERLEYLKMDGVLNCSGDGWRMIAGVVMIYGVLALASAALIKYLFSADRSRAAL